MVNITKVYTKTGDKGDTQLAAGVSISKCSLRIEAIGAVDELNAIIGLCVSQMRDDNAFEKLIEQSLRIQNELFNLGSQLAVLIEHRRDNTPLISDEDAALLEKEIDLVNCELPSLKSFILPGGSKISAQFHFARTACRRTERALVTLSREGQSIEPVILVYINRLSDWLFVMARYCNVIKKTQEILWK